LNQVDHALTGLALRPDLPGRVFALATLGGHTVFELEVVKARALLGAAGYGFVAHTVANADDHSNAPSCLLNDNASH